MGAEVHINYDAVLGEGSFGTVVYEGTYANKRVAVKLFQCVIDDIDKVSVPVERSNYEGNDNVARFLKVNVLENPNCFVVLDIHDKNLEQFLHTQVHLSTAKSVIQQIVDGVGYLHDSNIVHGNLCPSNILITNLVNGVLVVISDFQLFELMPIRWKEIAQSSSITFRTEWMAPEILQQLLLFEEAWSCQDDNISVVTTYSSDVFSVGCLLYYVATNGRHLFGGRLCREANILQNIKAYEFRCSYLPLMYLVSQMTTVDPSKRLSLSSAKSSPCIWSVQKERQFLNDLSSFVDVNLEETRQARYFLQKTLKIFIHEFSEAELKIEFGQTWAETNELIKAANHTSTEPKILSKNSPVSEFFLTDNFSAFVCLVWDAFHCMKDVNQLQKHYFSNCVRSTSLVSSLINFKKLVSQQSPETMSQETALVTDESDSKKKSSDAVTNMLCGDRLQERQTFDVIQSLPTDEKDKITRKVADVVESIDCKSVLISHPRATKIPAPADEHQLKVLASKLDRSEQLLNIQSSKPDAYEILLEELRKTAQYEALESLNAPIDFESSQHKVADISLKQFAHNQFFKSNSEDSGIRTFKKVPFHSKEATQLFTGRSVELGVLLDSLLPDGGTASITGIGGIGKTEVAKIFLQRLEEATYRNIFKQIIWINCESSFTAITEFTTIAKKYLKVPILGSSKQHPSYYREISSILHDIYEKLEKSKSLIVLDNVETKGILQTYLPKTSTKSKLSILVTSQSVKYGTHVPLDSLGLPEAVELVKKGLHIPVFLSEQFENGILELVKRLEMLPLAIIQAVGYIKEEREIHFNYGPHDYLGELDRIPEPIFDKVRFSCLSPTEKTIYKMLSLAVSRMEAWDSSGMIASKILSKVAFMAPDNIPASLFTELAEGDVDAIEKALSLIRRFCIVQYKPVHGKCTVYFSIHKLVQDVLRIRIDQNHQTESCMYLMMELLGSRRSYELTDHALRTWQHASKMDYLVEMFSGFPYSLTSQMAKTGRVSDAYDFSTSCLILLKQKLGITEHASTIFGLQGYNNWLLYRQGNFEYPLEKLHVTLDEAKKFLSNGDPVICRIQYYMAYIYFERGQIQKTASICDKMYEDYKLHKTVSLRTLFDIGMLLGFLKRFQDAQKTAKYILAHLNLISEKHREKLEFDTKCLMAEIHGSMGNYSECIALYSQILQTFVKDQNDMFSNFDLWSLFHNMGTYQFYAGLLKEAHESFRKGLDELNRRQEKDHYSVFHTKCNIAALILESNLVDKALNLSIEAYEQIKQVFGEKSYLTFPSLGNIGKAYSKVGRHNDAVILLTPLIKDEHYVSKCAEELMLIKYYLALSLEGIGSFDRSVELLNDLRLSTLQNPNFKLFTIEQVNSILNRIDETRNKQIGNFDST